MSTNRNSDHLPLANRHETPFAMTADILKKKRLPVSLEIARDRTQDLHPSKSTAGFRSRKFPWRAHAKTITLSPLGSDPLFKDRGKMESRAYRENLSISIDSEKERDGEKEGPKKRLARTTENPSSAFAQRLAPDTSTLPTTPQPPPHAG